jgi:Transposase
LNGPPDPRKVLCVALDYAKHKHMVLCCDGNGDIHKQLFAVENSSEGVAFLIGQISATARRRKIRKCNIFLGGEDEASYVANFTAALRSLQYLVMRVNAYEAKENRESLIASTDTLDLLGIAKTLLSRRARSTRPASTNLSKDKKPAEVDSLCCFAGIVPRTTQSEGPDQPACQGHTRHVAITSSRIGRLDGPKRTENPSLRTLRTQRTHLQGGMPTVSTASMRQHAVTCVCCAR